MISSVTTVPDGYGSASPLASIDDYGADPDKRDCLTERVPFAASLYRQMRSMRGDAYTKSTSGYVHSEHLAIARQQAAWMRAGERLSANSVPLTSDEKLAYWVLVYNLRSELNETRASIRRRLSGRHRAAVGPTDADIDEALAKLLGNAFVRTWRTVGTDLDTPPPPTYWPVNPGAVDWAIGTDSAGNLSAWFSARCHLVIEVQRTPGLSDADFLYLVNVQLWDMVDRMLPAWATVNWAVGITAGGFHLDLDNLDYTGMT